MRKREKYLEEGISALLPVYTQGVGDTTMLITLEGNQRVIHKKIKAVLKSIASSLSYDIVSFGKSMGKYWARRLKYLYRLSTTLY